MANIPAERRGSAVKSTSKVPSIEVRFFNRIVNIFIINNVPIIQCANMPIGTNIFR